MTPGPIAMPATLDQLESAWAAAAAAAIRAERAYHALAATGEDGDPLTSAAWLALWRAEERQREVGQELERLRMLLQDEAA